MALRYYVSRVRTHVRIEGELSYLKAREKYVRLLGDCFAAQRVEETLRKRHAEVEEEIEQLRFSFELPCLREDAKDQITARIQMLESSPIREVVLVNDLDDLSENQETFAFLSQAPAEVSHQIVFVADYVKDDINWRAVQVRLRNIIDLQKLFCTESFRPLCPTIGFNKHACSHFQNCRVPPPTMSRICSRTQNKLAKSLTKGCFVGIPQHIIILKPRGGGLEWSELRKRWTNASEPYKELPLTYLRNSTSSFASCTVSSRRTQESQKKRCQSYLGFTGAFLKVTTLKQSARSFSCLYFSQSENVRNKDFLCGEIN